MRRMQLIVINGVYGCSFPTVSIPYRGTSPVFPADFTVPGAVQKTSHSRKITVIKFFYSF
jgi:hypothetical protein